MYHNLLLRSWIYPQTFPETKTLTDGVDLGRCARVMFVSFTIKHDHYLNLRETLWSTLPAVGMETVSSRNTGQKTHTARGESELMFPKLCGGLFGT